MCPREVNSHRGNQVKRLRETMGIKQETIALKMGMSQQSVSYYEKQEEINDTLLVSFAKALGVDLEVLKNYDGEKVMEHFEDKVKEDNGNRFENEHIEAIHALVRMEEKIEQLYDDLLKSEREKNDLLRQVNQLMLELSKKVKADSSSGKE